MYDEISPEIAALLEHAEKSLPSGTTLSIDADLPDIEDTSTNKSQNVNPVNLNIKGFAEITDFFSQTPLDVFADSAYYKTALSGENDSSQRLHAILTKYLTCKDPKDRSVYRQQLIPIYWDFIRSVAKKMVNASTPLPKKLLVRFGAILPTLLNDEQKDLFSSVFMDNHHGEPIYYIDEWFRDIARGIVGLSATDEARPKKKGGKSGNNIDDTSKLMQLQSKNSSKLQSAESLLLSKENERSMAEAELKSKVEQLCDHIPLMDISGHKAPLNDLQKRLFNEITEKLKQLQRIDKDLNLYISEYREAKEISTSLQQKLDEAGDFSEDIDTSNLDTEIATIRQMAKMTVGRQGNHFPILTREFFHCTPRGTGFRENVLATLAWIESIDPGAFCRIHRNQSNRIVPYVILVPTYGDSGLCWEPFDRYNRTSSRGRIVIPMYPKNLQIAVLTAVADLRWQVAKEKASYHWMEEGLTGQYYMWFASQKLKGDVKDYFIEDYVSWITKESEGVQRLEKDVRGVFWRYVPFAQEIKDTLKTRSPIYQELYQRDINRSMSDGY
ncbi:MAG: hypothetical protein GX220_04230 [Treponema sp.]|nr:hypothetical protein [Treponema sp.]